jgi:hypothetical protein
MYVWWGNGCDDPPDSTQYPTMLLNMECGSIRIADECDLMIGDVNMNRRAFEIGDVILMANHIGSPEDYPFTAPQLYVSDVNSDGVQGSIADLVMMIGIANGTIPWGKVLPVETPADVVIAYQRDGSAVVELQSSYAIGGLVIDLPIPDPANRDVECNQALGMDIIRNDRADGVRLLIYSNTGAVINPGTTQLLRIGDAENLSLDPSEIAISDAVGGLAEAIVTHELPLPETFGISACYPNPFNPVTTIRFTMPTDESVTLSIYDITGRLVAKLVNGNLTAGYHEITWNGTNAAGKKVTSGVYFAKLTADSNAFNTSVEKIVLLK